MRERRDRLGGAVGFFRLSGGIVRVLAVSILLGG